jgi:hypothetical protein
MTKEQEQAEAQAQAQENYAARFSGGCKLAAAGLNLIRSNQLELGRGLVKMGSTMMDGYTLSDVLPLAFGKQDLKFGAALCVEILEDEVAQID